MSQQELSVGGGGFGGDGDAAESAFEDGEGDGEGAEGVVGDGWRGRRPEAGGRVNHCMVFLEVPN